MSVTLNTFPVLTEKMKGQSGFVSELHSASYSENYEEYYLQIEERSLHAGKIKDPRGSWNAETHGITIKGTCRFSAAYLLFGLDGITGTESVLGLAVRWISSKSDVRGVMPFGQLTKNDSSKAFDFTLSFEKGKLKGSLRLEIILYLKQAGLQNKREQMFAATEGTVLGGLEQYELFIDGNGSVFPIVTINAPGEPLWSVYYDDSCDATHDSFDEDHVEIRLNRDHPNYVLLKIETAMKDSPIFLEVVSSALLIIVMSAKSSLCEEWEEVLNGNGFERGSIAEAIYYFHSKLGWDMSTPTVLYASIRNYFEKNL